MGFKIFTLSKVRIYRNTEDTKKIDSNIKEVCAYIHAMACGVIKVALFAPLIKMKYVIDDSAMPPQMAPPIMDATNKTGI